MKVEWSRLARLDILEIFDYIAEENQEAALRLHEEIERQVDLLARMPDIGRMGRIRGTRELVIAGTNYLAAYRIGKSKVFILRVIHGARRWPDEL